MTLSVVKTWIEGEVLTATDLNAEITNITNTGFGATTFGDHTVISTGSNTGRALDDRFADEIHVKDFGAVGNGTTDDATAIQAAIDAAETRGGGTVLFSPGIYAIATGLVVDKPGVVLRGQGYAGIIHDAEPQIQTTMLKWTGGSGATMLKFTSVSGGAEQTISGCGVFGVGFDSNDVADIGLQVVTARRCKFEQMKFENFLVAAVDLTCLTGTNPTADGSGSVADCSFENISARQGFAASGNAFRLDSSTTTQNINFCKFENIVATYRDSDAFLLGNTDNNTFLNLKLVRSSAGGSGFGVRFKARALAAHVARANYFISLNPGTAGVTAEGTPSATVASFDNNIIFYDQHNANPDPVIEAGASLHWSDHRGILQNYRSGKMIIATSGSVGAAITAEETLASNTALFLYSTADDHLILQNQDTERWRIRIENSSGNLDILRSAGSGHILLDKAVEFNTIFSENVTLSISAAGTTQGAGTAMTKAMNQVTTAAGGVNDAVVLPNADTGITCVVMNDSGATIQVFPASGDSINNLATNAADTGILDNTRRMYKSVDGTQWYSFP